MHDTLTAEDLRFTPPELLEFQARYVVEDDNYLRSEGIPMARTGLDRILALDPDRFLEVVTQDE